MKFIGAFLMLASFSLTISAQQADLINDPHLRLHYNFNNVVDSVVTDHSPSNINGKINNGTVCDGKVHSGIEFNDSSTYVYVGNDSQLEVRELTVMAWVKPYSLGSDHQRMEILEKTDGYWLNIRNGNQIDRIEEKGKLRVGGFFRKADDSGKTWLYMDTKDTVKTNVWTHAAFTFDGTTMSSYLNGELQNTMDAPNYLHTSDWFCSVGCKISKKDVLEAMFHGIIDEVYLFSRALSTEEIDDYLGVIDDIGTNISSVPKLAGRLYPNPATVTAFFEPFDRHEPFTIKLFDHIGRCVFTNNYTAGSKVSINVSGLKPGLYLLEYKTKNAKIIQRLLTQ